MIKQFIEIKDKILSQKEAIKHFKEGLNTFYKDIKASSNIFHDEKWRQKNNGFYFLVTANVNINEDSIPYIMEIKYSLVKDHEKEQEGFYIDLSVFYFEQKFASTYLPINDHKIKKADWIVNSKGVLDMLREHFFESMRYSLFKFGDRRITKLFNKNIMVV